MDPKKQELNPELKQIYERVMNTQVGAPASPQSPISEQAPTQSVPPHPAIQTPAKATTNVTQDPFQASAPQGPAVDTKPFVFTGNKVTTPQETHTPQSQSAAVISKKMSEPIIAVLALILIVVWGLFWAKFFGLI